VSTSDREPPPEVDRGRTRLLNISMRILRSHSNCVSSTTQPWGNFAGDGPRRTKPSPTSRKGRPAESGGRATGLMQRSAPAAGRCGGNGDCDDKGQPYHSDDRDRIEPGQEQSQNRYGCHHTAAAHLLAMSSRSPGPGGSDGQVPTLISSRQRTAMSRQFAKVRIVRGLEGTRRPTSVVSSDSLDPVSPPRRRFQNRDRVSDR